MTDTVEINDLLLRTIIGVNPEERVNRQDVIISVRLDADLRAAAASDNIDDAVNYRTITKNIIDLVESSSFHLVERMAEAIARKCLADERVQRAWVRVLKPGALRFAKTVGVTIERSREDL